MRSQCKFLSMNNSKVLYIVVAILICLCKSQAQSQPNIIYIMVDDLGYGDFSCYGQTDYQTPNIDLFAREGIKFNNAYSAAPICTPTRVAFMTGQYPARNDIGLREPLTMSNDDINIGLSADIPTVALLLKELNYETALFGKWHLGFQKEFFPTRNGFDIFFGIIAGAADYVDHRPINRYGNNLIKGDLHILYENDTPVERSGYLTDLITESAISYINQKHDKPFFISIQYTAPHWPWQIPGSKPVADTLNYFETGSKEDFSLMMMNLDDNFGKLMNALKTANLEQNTLVILTSDNGGDLFSNMKPYKGMKVQLWEGGIRVPALVRWPGIINYESESNQLIITMDWTATILDVANYTRLMELKLDGISLKEHFARPGYTIERTFYWRTSNRVQSHALRKGNWKYLSTRDGEFLFNLVDDPYESINLVNSHTNKVSELKKEYSKIDREMLRPIILEK